VHSFKTDLLTFSQITFNTQKSSQWDGLRHFGYQEAQKFYMGVTKEEFSEPSGKLGIQNWHTAGGIAGRGVLIDWWSWAEKNGKVSDMSEDVAIIYDDLMSCLQDQQAQSALSLDIRHGDILLVRSGYTQQYLKLDDDRETAVGNAFPMKTCGVHQDESLLSWLWENRIAAVGGDSQAFECFPPKEGSQFLFHEVLLAGWGCPIAEILYLEDLAAFCRERRTWTFFLSSSPLNIHGGVASPANMMAIV
jgi:kynurenine formamidase